MPNVKPAAVLLMHSRQIVALAMLDILLSR